MGVAGAGDDAIQVLRNSPATFAAGLLTANDAVAAGYSLKITGVTHTGGHGGSVVLNGESITYTPPENYVGTDSFTYTVNDGHGGAAVGTVAVSVRAGGGVLLPGGGVRLIFQGVGNRTYRVETAASLTMPDWQPLGTAMADQTGVITFDDLPPAGTPTRFYRIMYP